MSVIEWSAANGGLPSRKALDRDDSMLSMDSMDEALLAGGFVPAPNSSMARALSATRGDRAALLLPWASCVWWPTSAVDRRGQAPRGDRGRGSPPHWRRPRRQSRAAAQPICPARARLWSARLCPSRAGLLSISTVTAGNAALLRPIGGRLEHA
ncbi:hypothetical protein MTO96_009785 [Rhipicephalus appendiculatus]